MSALTGDACEQMLREVVEEIKAKSEVEVTNEIATFGEDGDPQSAQLI